jgi:cytochrome oxidase Cu insertion factor (SCO1/SenC/PrrC family)
MSVTLAQAIQLKQQFVDFVYDAEDELATALEQYAADHGTRDRQDIRQQNLVVDTFLTEGNIQDQTPIDLFLASGENLSESERDLIEKWQQSFIGLFEVIDISSEGVKLMNWLTAKYYTVLPTAEVPESEISRWKPGEIILTRLAPLNSKYWIFSGACLPKGRLSQPKLAVAIGEFKQNYQDSLYSDAPELLEKAWESVDQYHQAFVDFFGTDKITLPGYKLNQKITELQEKMAQKQLASAGIDPSKSLSDIMKDIGSDTSEVKAGAEAVGADSQVLDKALNQKATSAMITPKAELPNEIKQAEKVTAFSNTRWGQMFIPSYTQFTDLLQACNFEDKPNAEALVQKYLTDQTINYYVWQQLQQTYPTELEALLKQVLNRPNFNLESDLKPLLKEYNKSLEPQLSEMASVPLHLHNLFQEAVAQVSRSKSKSKSKKKQSKGFQS